MSLVNIGLRDLPNLYVEQVYINKRDPYLPKIKVSLVLKDGVINNRLIWSRDQNVLDFSKIVYVLEDRQGKEYVIKKEPLSSVVDNLSTHVDSKGNTICTYKIEKIIDVHISYNNDKSLILKTYTESTNDQGYVYRSSIMREAIQNSDGSFPEKSFYFTLPSGERYAGPFHYHEPSDSYMLGAKHSSQSHPTLKLHYTKNRTISFNNLEKTLSFVNKKKNSYNFNPKTIMKSYVTKNNDRSVSSLFVIDLYKVLLTVDEQAQTIYELNQDLFKDITRDLVLQQMTIGRVAMGRVEYENILYTPIVKSVELGKEENLVSILNVEEKKYTSKKANTEVYYHDNILHALITDKDIIGNNDGKYKYVVELKTKGKVLDYIKSKLNDLYSVIAYYDVFLESLKNPKLYDANFGRLTNSYIKDIFGKYTDFTSPNGVDVIMKQTPEFHKHIDTMLENLKLLKKIDNTERYGLYDNLDQLINPMSTNQLRILHFLKICRDLATQIRRTYRIDKPVKIRPTQKQTTRLELSLRDTTAFEYNNVKKTFKVFKNLTSPVVSMSRMKKRFSTEHTRYFQKNLGDTSFNLLPSPLRSSFKSVKDSRYKFLSPIMIQTKNKNVDLENFDVYDDIADSLYEAPTLRIEKKTPSNLTLLNKDNSALDASKILGEASDFVINKINIRKNVRSTIDPMILNYSVSTNKIVDIDINKFDLNKQENLLLSYIKNQDAESSKKSLRNLPFQTKSLFYPGNIKNPLNRIKASKNFKVKRLIKSVAFTTYKMEYLEGYRQHLGSNQLRSVHAPMWKDMTDPSRINIKSKYILARITPNDEFGYRNSNEYSDSQRFVLIKNNKYMEELHSLISHGDRFQKQYTLGDFTSQSYETLSLLDNSMKKTISLASEESTPEDDGNWSPERYSLFNSVTDSTTKKVRSRTYIKSKQSINNQNNKGKY